MGWHVEINVTCVAADGQFVDLPDEDCDPRLEFGTLKELVAFLKGVGRLAGKDEFEEFVEAVRQEGRMVQMMFTKCMPVVSAAIRRRMEKLRRRGVGVVRRTGAV